MKNLLYGPWWLLQLFSTAKSFCDNPLIGHPRLNKWGLHISRIRLTHGIMKWRMWLLSSKISPADRQSFQQQGYILKENYLPDEDFRQLELEIRQFQGQPRISHQGDTETRKTLLDPETLQDLPHTARLLANPDFRNLLRYSNGHRRLPFFNIELIRNGVQQGAMADPQKNLHSDTFHPTMKFWFYLDDVDEHNGPFTYIPGSNRPDRLRLDWEHRMSQIARHHPDRMAARGSFRYAANDLAQLKLAAPRVFRVKKNTLLIANTFGIHGRGQADEGSTRLAIWGMGRTNPFLPFPGFGFEWVNRYQYEILKWLEGRK